VSAATTCNSQCGFVGALQRRGQHQRGRFVAGRVRGEASFEGARLRLATRVQTVVEQRALDAARAVVVGFAVPHEIEAHAIHEAASALELTTQPALETRLRDGRVLC